MSKTPKTPPAPRKPPPKPTSESTANSRTRFDNLSSEERKAVARKGGKATARSKKAHRFTSKTAKKAGSKGGKKGGEAKARAGRLGGLARAKKLREAALLKTATEKKHTVWSRTGRKSRTVRLRKTSDEEE